MGKQLPDTWSSSEIAFGYSPDGPWVQYSDYQSEKARADAAEAGIAALEAGMRWLVESWAKPSPYMHACCHEVAREISDDLSALLNLPAE